MIERVTALNVYSIVNTWFDIIILLSDNNELEKAEKIISEAYDRWFNTETGDSMTIAEYIESELDQENIKHTIYFNMKQDDV